MIINEITSSGTMAHALSYNFRKVTKGCASVVDYENFGEGATLNDIMPVFKAYEIANKRSTNICFHASINPSKDDRISDEGVLELAKELMRKLGMEKQPYVVFKHEDIKRTHYHIVSIKTDENGNKIKDSFSHLKIQECMLEQAARLGFEIGLEKSKEQTQQQTPTLPSTTEHLINQTPLGTDNSRSLPLDTVIRELERHEQTRPVGGNAATKANQQNPTFHYEEGNIVRQMQTICNQILQYHFTTHRQAEDLLASYGLMPNNELKGSDGGQCILYGMSKEGKKVGKGISERELGINLREDIEKKIKEGLNADLRSLYSQRARVLAIHKFSVDKSKTEDEYCLRLANKGITVDIERNGTGRIIGVNYIDHTSKCVFKASELRTATKDLTLRETLSPEAFEDKAKEWKENQAQKDALLNAKTQAKARREKLFTQRQKERKERQGRYRRTYRLSDVCFQSGQSVGQDMTADDLRKAAKEAEEEVSSGYYY